MARKQTPTCRALIPMRFQLGKEAKNMVELLNNKLNPDLILGRFMVPPQQPVDPILGSEEFLGLEIIPSNVGMDLFHEIHKE